MADPRELPRAEVAALGLDRRRKYARIDGKLCQLAQWTQACSGCVAMDDNLGCHECGYTGSRRVRAWVPVEMMEASRG